jgi:hypothetical protein
VPEGAGSRKKPL